METSLESFKKLRRLPPHSPEWEALRDRIIAENTGLAYYAVNRAGGWFLNRFSGEARSQAREDLLQHAFTELTRVVEVYDPERLNPLDSPTRKHIKFATFAVTSLLGAVTTYCKKESKHTGHDPLSGRADDEDGEFPHDDPPAPPSSAELELERRVQLEHCLSQLDPGLAARLEGVLNKLRDGNEVTIFERQMLFRMIADSSLILMRPERAGVGSFGDTEVYEPLPLRRHRWWRQMVG